VAESLIGTLELLSDRSMPGFRRRMLGEWVLRSGLGATGRANSVWPTGDPGVPVASAVDEAERWYREQGLRPNFQLFAGTDSELVAELDRRGYGGREGAVVMTAELSDLVFAPDPPGVQLVSEAEPSEHQFVLMDDVDRMAELTAADLDRRFIAVLDSAGGLLGGGVAVRDGAWVGVFAMKTLPEARRRGVATRVLEEIARWSEVTGAERMWLQVVGTNSAARALYRRAGLVDSHLYQYRHHAD